MRNIKHKALNTKHTLKQWGDEEERKSNTNDPLTDEAMKNIDIKSHLCLCCF